MANSTYKNIWQSALLKITKSKAKNDSLSLASVIIPPSTVHDCYIIPLEQSMVKMIISCSCLPLYLFVLFVMCKYRGHLAGSFFTLCLSSGISDIFYDLLFILNYFKIVGWLRDILPSGEVSYLGTSLYEIFLQLLQYCQALGLIFIAANRMTALVFPLRHVLIWKKNRVIGVLFSQWLLPALIYIPQITWVLKKNTFQYQKGITVILYQIYHFLLSAILSILLIILNVSTFWAMYHHNKKISSIAAAKNLSNDEKVRKEKQQRNLAIAAALLCIPYILFTVFKILLKVLVYSYFKDLLSFCDYTIIIQVGYLLMNFSESLFVNINPFVLLLLSRNLRKRAKELLHGQESPFPSDEEAEYPESAESIISYFQAVWTAQYVYGIFQEMSDYAVFNIYFVTCIAFLPQDDRYFLSGSLDAKLRLWDIPDKKVAIWNEMEGGRLMLTFVKNGKFAVVGTFDGRCIFYSME